MSETARDPWDLHPAYRDANDEADAALAAWYAAPTPVRRDAFVVYRAAADREDAAAAAWLDACREYDRAQAVAANG
jgi:hypothetical protein